MFLSARIVYVHISLHLGHPEETENQNLGALLVTWTTQVHISVLGEGSKWGCETEFSCRASSRGPQNSPVTKPYLLTQNNLTVPRQTYLRSFEKLTLYGRI